MNENIVGLDWDNILLSTAKKRQKIVELEEETQTLLFQTKNGFHLKIIYLNPISVKKNFEIREKYWDCETRLRYSKARYETSKQGYDVLFNMKEGVWEKLLG